MNDTLLMLSESETAALIKSSESSGRILPLRFGPGWVALDTNAEGWVYFGKRLLDIRKNVVLQPQPEPKET